MKSALPIAFLFLLMLGAEWAEASLVVDPTAAALGSSSVFDPLDDEAETPLTPTVRTTPVHWQGNRTSDVYLVRRGGEDSAWFSRPGVPGTLRPIQSGQGTVDVSKLGGGGLIQTTPRIHDPNRDEWLGLEMRRGRRPIVVVPIGGGQPHTPTTPAPEPGTIMLLASGLGAMGAAGFARRRQAKQG